MSKRYSLKAESRQRTGSGMLKRMRREGWVPSVIYGRGLENVNVKIPAKEFEDLLADSASANILLDLVLEEGGTRLAFLKDLQKNPISGAILHVDFLAVDEKTEVTATLPLELHGEAIGVKAGGLLEQLVHTLEVKCLPSDLPEIIEAQVADLDIGDAIHVGELDLPDGVMATLPPDVLVVLVAKARVEELDEEDSEEEATEASSDEEATEEEAKE